MPPEDPKDQNQGTKDQDPGQSKDQGKDKSQDPAWLSAIADEGMREEARKSYMLQQDYTKKTQELAEQRKGWEDGQSKLKQYEDWYQKQYVPFATALQPHWSDVQALLTGKAAPANSDPGKPAPSPTGDNPFENWDLLPPQEQVSTLTKHLQGTVFEPAVKQMQNQLMEHLKQREQYWQNYITILTDAFERKANNPDLPIKDFMQKAVEYQTGKVDPLDMAYQSLVSPAEQEKMQKEWYERGKKDYEQELANRKQDQGALENEGMRTFNRSPNPRKRDEIQQSVREKALAAGIPWN